MKTNAVVRIVLFSLTILILLGILLVGLAAGLLVTNIGKVSDSIVNDWISEDKTDKNLWDNFSSGDVINQVGTIEADKIEDISIEWVSGSITILPGNGDKISISESEVSHDKYKLVWKQSGNKLSIQFCEPTWNFMGINLGTDLNKDLVISVPRDWICDSLEIDTASARVEVTDLTIREVEFDGASGSCYFDNCNVEELDLDTASGDVNFTGTLQNLDCDAASASINVEVTNNPKRIDIDTASGDLDLTLPENCGFSVSLDTISGDFTSDFPTTMTAGNYVHGDGSCRINITAMSGDVIIRKAP